MCVEVCVCVHDNWLEGGAAVEVANCKKTHQKGFMSHGKTL